MAKKPKKKPRLTQADPDVFPLKEYVDTLMQELICAVKSVRACDLGKWLYCSGLPTIYKAMRAIVCYLFDNQQAKLYRHIFNAGIFVSDPQIINEIGMNFEVYSYSDTPIVPTTPTTANFITALTNAQTNNQPGIVTAGTVHTINGSILWKLNDSTATTRAIIGIRFLSATSIKLEAPGIDGPMPGSLSQIQYDVNTADITSVEYFTEQIIPV